MAEKKSISKLTAATEFLDNDLFLVSEPGANTSTGYASKKITGALVAAASKIFSIVADVLVDEETYEPYVESMDKTYQEIVSAAQGGREVQIKVSGSDHTDGKVLRLTNVADGTNDLIFVYIGPSSKTPYNNFYTRVSVKNDNTYTMEEFPYPECPLIIGFEYNNGVNPQTTVDYSSLEILRAVTSGTSVFLMVTNHTPFGTLNMTVPFSYEYSGPNEDVVFTASKIMQEEGYTDYLLVMEVTIDSNKNISCLVREIGKQEV